MKTIFKYTLAIAALLGFSVNGWADKLQESWFILPANFNHVVYDGSPHNVSLDDMKPITFSSSAPTLTLGTDFDLFTVSSGPYINAGTTGATYSILGKGSYTGEFSYPFIIDPAYLTDESRFTITPASVAYTGSAITPSFVIHDGTRNADLTVSTEYTLSGTTSAIDPGTYTVTFTGIVNYAGARNFTWTITKGLADANVSVAPATYNGTAQTPTVVVKDGTKVLSQGVDYTLTLSNASGYTNADTYTNAVTVTGIGAYTGTIKKDFVIAKKDINLCTVTGNSVIYTGSPITTLSLSVMDGTYSATYDATYPTTYSAVGTYSEAITITGNGNYTGTKKVDLIIAPGTATDIATAVVTSSVIYTGSQQEPTASNVTVKVGTTTLTEGTDFTLSIKGAATDYVDAKTYANAIVITGKGGYYGSQIVDYTIQPRNINEASVSGNSANYTGSAITPTITVSYGGNDLTSGTDYDITISSGYTYQDPQVYADAITLTGKGNFTGTRVLDYTITNTGGAKNLATAVVTSTAIYNGVNQKPSASTITVTIGTTVLELGTDFTMVVNGDEDNDYVNAGNYENAIALTAKGANYYGTLSADYVIAKRDMQDVTLTEVKKMAWTGLTLTPIINDATPENSNITAKYDTYNLKAADYTYTSEPTPIKEPGEYTLTFEGRGNFMGTKQMTVHVLKSFATQGGDVTLDLINDCIILPNAGTLTTADITVKDGSTVLVEGTDYTANIYTKREGSAEPYTYSADVASITKDGIYWMELTGKDDYSWKDKKVIEFYVLNEYYVKGDEKMDAASRVCSIHLTDPTEAALGTSNTDPVVATTATELTIPATATITLKDEQGSGSNSTTKVVNLVDIENGAFIGCNTLRFIDATAMTSYVPSSLNREGADTPFQGLPKQTLVYLAGTTVAGENYIYKVAAGAYRCDVYKIYDDVIGNQQGFDGETAAKWDVTIPIAFTANTVSNTRQLNSVVTVGSETKQQGYTVFLPYALPKSESFKAYTLAYSKGTTTIGSNTYDGVVGFTEVTGALTAATPYVIIPSASGQLLSATNVNVMQTYEVGSGFLANLGDGSSAVSGQMQYELYGTFQYMDGYDASNPNYIMQKANEWKKIAATGTYATQCILPMRAYLHTDAAAPARLYSVFTDADGSTTAISKLQLDSDAQPVIYDLQGRKVSNPQRGGLYIVNGKKVVMK